MEDVEFLTTEFSEGKLADSLPYQSESSTVTIYYYELWQPRKLDLGGGLFLLCSKLGWILGG